MASTTGTVDKAPSVKLDDLYEDLGTKAQKLSFNNGSSSFSSDYADNISGSHGGDGHLVDELDSLCMNCHEQGTTRLLLTRVPYFREIILMSFSCPHCYFKNSEIQSAGEIQQKGARYELRLTTLADFARQIVKSDTCVAKFIEIDVEVPAGRGQLTNVEGILTTIIEDLSMGQSERQDHMPGVYAKVEEIITRGRQMLAGEGFPFRVSVDDPAGNSWIEPNEKDGVGKWSKVEYPRTPEQNETLGLSPDKDLTAQTPSSSRPYPADIEDDNIVPNEVYSFPASCPGCMKDCATRMKMVEIPHFKEVIIMSTVCDHCGYRSNEVKTGGEVPVMGRKITLKVDSAADLARDILKSESCYLECPELKLAVNPGTLGGRFTTVEGLLTQVCEDLRSNIFDVDDAMAGDSIPSEAKEKWDNFFAGIDEAIKGYAKFTIILTDPLASSYVQNLYLPDEDPQINIEDYKRTDEEEEELGLKDIVTEGYVDDVGEEKERERLKPNENAVGKNGAAASKSVDGEAYPTEQSRA